MSLDKVKVIEKKKENKSSHQNSVMDV